MSTLTLHQEHLKTILNHAEQAYPYECCGLLMGKIEKNHQKIVVEVIPTENAWNPETAQEFQTLEPQKKLPTTQETYFTIAPEVMIKAQKEGRDRNLSIIGIYHSHPDHPAIPSEFDRRCAWSSYSYIIASVQNGQVIDIRNWSLDDHHQFQPEEMIRA